MHRNLAMGGFQSGQMGLTVTQLSVDFGGSNPSPPTLKKAGDAASNAASPASFYPPDGVVEGVSKCDFAMSRDVACRISMSATMYKTFNINGLSNQTVETQNFASLLPH